jgi:peptidyl-prolyl cis-trans isomerase D
VFSRTEYEKFLIEKNISAVMFENNLLSLEKKKHFLDLIGGGVLPSNFLINSSFNRINQKRNIEIINLNDAFEKQINFSEKEIIDYFENNKEQFSEIYKFIKIIELTPKNLVNSEEFNDIFFKKIDEIDDLLIVGNGIDFIMKEYDLKLIESYSINSSGKNLKMNVINNISKNLVKNIFNKEENQKANLIEDEGKFFVIEVTKTENILREMKDQSTRKKIIEKIKFEKKRRLISEIIVQINNNNFKKSDFNKLSKDKNAKIQKVSFENQNDDKVLEKDLVSEIYSYGEKKIIAVSDFGFEKNFLIYIDSIKNVNIDKNTNDYDKYHDLSKVKLTSELFNTYDFYIKNKYKIDINNKALDIVKNYFN